MSNGALTPEEPPPEDPPRGPRRQRSIYLGRCAELARRVCELLAGLQRPRRQRRLFVRLIAQVRASLRRSKVGLRRQLAQRGIRLKGFEFRGERRALATGPIAGTHLAFIPRRL